MINSKNIYLRPMEIADVRIKVKWLNDEQVRKTLGFSDYPVSLLATEAWLKKVAGDSKRKDFMLCLQENDEPIGFCGIKNIDLVNLKAESYLGIGNIDYWGKGIGLETKKVLLDYSFNFLNLNKVYSYHQADNEAMIKINLKLGAQREGLLREEIRLEGEMKDMVLMSVLRKDYFDKNTTNS
ncbi:GNAT family N-acetyltransferase [Daejeonella oryzae]|uniref:GNAT family N-acetyltransferase n=1 Tax=Daejeonella oryzae TaxID=1122943 RepID=UPI000415197C|nr:GNAT family protein [Daejeonella oryzae]